MLTTTIKGSIAEAVIAAEAVTAGVMVLRPVVEGRRYDLVFDLGHRMLRVQCKAVRYSGGVVTVHTRTSRHTPRGYVWTTYTEEEIDAIAVYCPQLVSVYPLPVELVRRRRGSAGLPSGQPISAPRYTSPLTSPFLGL